MSVIVSIDNPNELVKTRCLVMHDLFKKKIILGITNHFCGAVTVRVFIAVIIVKLAPSLKLLP